MKTELEAGKKWNCLSMKMGMILFLQSGPFIIGDRPYWEISLGRRSWRNLTKASGNPTTNKFNVRMRRHDLKAEAGDFFRKNGSPNIPLWVHQWAEDVQSNNNINWYCRWWCYCFFDIFILRYWIDDFFKKYHKKYFRRYYQIKIKNSKSYFMNKHITKYTPAAFTVWSIQKKRSTKQ